MKITKIDKFRSIINAEDGSIYYDFKGLIIAKITKTNIYLDGLLSLREGLTKDLLCFLWVSDTKELDKKINAGDIKLKNLNKGKARK